MEDLIQYFLTVKYQCGDIYSNSCTHFNRKMLKRFHITGIYTRRSR